MWTYGKERCRGDGNLQEKSFGGLKAAQRDPGEKHTEED
jgi:hypothetical protein